MNQDELKNRLEELEIPSDKIDEVVLMLQDKLKDKKIVTPNQSDAVFELQNKLMGEI